MGKPETSVMVRAKVHADLVDNRCMALTRDGTRCTAHKKAGSDFCPAHTNLSKNQTDREHGRYIGYAGEMDKVYQEGLQDKYLLHLRDEIAILDGRLKDLISQSKTGVNGQAWLMARREFEKLKRAYSSDDPMAISAAVKGMQEAFDAGKFDIDLWKDIERTMEMRRKLVETEQKYLVQSNQVIPYEAVMLMMSAAITALKSSVAKYVASKDLEEVIIIDAQREFDSLIGSGQSKE